MGLRENLKSRRLELQLTLEHVAKAIGVSKPTLQRYESGVIANVPYDKVEKLATVLHTTPATLMGWDKKWDIQLPPAEQNLIRKYRVLDSRGKETVKALLDFEYDIVSHPS